MQTFHFEGIGPHASCRNVPGGKHTKEKGKMHSGAFSQEE